MTTRTTPAAPLLDDRALNRATLARQLLLRRAPTGAEEAVDRLVGLQAQNTRPPYLALAARLEGFRPEELSGLMERRAVARTVTLRSTLHTHTAEDVLALRALVQPARERELSIFRRRLTGVDLERLAGLARELVEERPRTPKELREELAPLWPDADPPALSVAARCLLPLVQVTPRGLWGRSGQVALTTAEKWLGREAVEPAGLDATVKRYLAAFGPASVKDMQLWAGLTRLRPAFERLRPELAVFRDERGTELFDLPDAPRPEGAEEAPPRLLPEFDNLLLSHADRRRLVPPAAKDRTWKGNQAFPVFLVDGLVAGVWRLEEGAGRAVVVLEPFGRLSRDERTALVEEAGRTAGVLSGAEDRDVRFGTVID
ncbi:winged helix DNA-binding domain-containing protein [Streptomyces sp. NPDC047097]|uniref:winged helix DNA-binding domain-containing protein n=1 Tax=Streptomyces sp. NPDC047097 TaxID=3155260 RepID=UPI0033D66043